MNDTLEFDFMLDGRYICTMAYKYCPLFPIEEERLKRFIETKRPSLRGKDYHIEFVSQIMDWGYDLPDEEPDDFDNYNND